MNREPLRLSFTEPNPGVDEKIRDLMEAVGGIHESTWVRQIILAALKAGQESASALDLKVMNTTLKEMRFTAKVFGPYRGVRKVTVFGSARTTPEEPAYQMAAAFGRLLAQAGFMVITGGGPGIMQAVNEGAGPEHSFGVTIRLPFEQSPNPVLANSPRVIHYKYFFNRKVAFLKEADAVALFPGGFGTLDEAMEALTLLQTGKRNPMPLVLIDPPEGDYWLRWMHFLKENLLERSLISDSDFHLFHRVTSPEAAVAYIRDFYRRYHSLRYVGNVLVVRLTDPVPASAVDQWNREFSHILVPGGSIRAGKALEEEADEPEVMHLPRLLVDFNRRDFGRLRQLIDAVNGA
ncbi:hypothetical protein SAMN02746041_00156 [Desulfacinum hydrothermale DSM 13146]|uniref:AMP nucleosidase n=1 Tax=Desulfacinum hydrothermale DSM 13146 TaxID=1121390 RepID=A0A1W1X033_9BACT|nr:TIGR00730 family Rossman fold protein [Desulfacinum hydrothermale]SMC16751.1 hypothetical protein SAMN02746041_00156 [Desulfacinum hydrothermale DSM 13146]